MAKSQLNIKVKKFTELTDAQWAKIQSFVETGRKISKDLRQVALLQRSLIFRPLRIAREGKYYAAL